MVRHPEAAADGPRGHEGKRFVTTSCRPDERQATTGRRAPPGSATGGSRVASTLNLVYNQAGELLVNGEKKSFDEAARIVRQEAEADAKTQAVISADRGVEYGKVIEIIDLVKQNGITAFALDVERTAAPAPPAP